MSNFKQCSNGHYYTGDVCPYCTSSGKSITVGRDTQCDYIIRDPFVSNRHCIIEQIGEDRYCLTDLDSTNGTFVNGRKVLGSVEIGPYDIVRVGNTLVEWMTHFASLDEKKRRPLGGIIYFPKEDSPSSKDPDGDAPSPKN